MPDDDITITEEDIPSVSAEEVLQYMEDHAEQQEEEREEAHEEDAPSTPEESSGTFAQDQEPVDQESPETSYYFSADASFTQSDIDDVDKELFTEVDNTKIEVTSEDKTMYLKAVLNDVPVQLDIPLLGGRIFVSCRALTAQEKMVVPIGCIAYCEKHRSYPMSALGTLVQLTRLAMQVTKVNNRPCAYVSLKEPLTHLEEISDTLVPDILAKVRDISSARYNYLIQALNVFEHKLARLSDAAFDQDFWDPAATD